jgi:hypothetical protein
MQHIQHNTHYIQRHRRSYIHQNSAAEFYIFWAFFCILFFYFWGKREIMDTQQLPELAALRFCLLMP